MGLIFTGDWLPQKAPRIEVLKGDFAVGNLECAFNGQSVQSTKAYTSILSYACIPNIAKCGVAAFSLANNHSYDANNLEGTLKRLREDCPDIQFFGTVERPFAILGSVIVIGCLEPCRSRGPLIFKQENVTPLIRRLVSDDVDRKKKIYIYPHWGKEGEYTRYPSPMQRRLAHQWIDAGADGVFGGHPHVPQGREYYKGRPIYYSLGNYDFDHPESDMYEGTRDVLAVHINADGQIFEVFSSTVAKEAVENVSRQLPLMGVWQWARLVGPFNLMKNARSWRRRLRKHFFATIPKFIVWQFLPTTMLFRVASLWPSKHR